MKRQRITVGSILEINVHDLYYCYAQILEHGVYAFFDYRTETPLRDFSVLLGCKILFCLGVYNDVITRGHWLKVGKLPIRDDLTPLPMEFIYHEFDKLQWHLYNPNTGEMTSSTKEECRGLERCAAWDAHHVEDRLRDHYDGVPCLWLNGVYEIFEDEYGFEIRREITPVGTQLWLTKTIEEEGKLYECSYIYHFDEDFTSNAKYTIEIKKILKGEAP